MSGRTEVFNKVARAQGVSTITLREALKQGVIPYGRAFQAVEGGKYTYLLFPEKVREYLGIDLGKMPFVQEDETL